jgi:hypothetical protein
MKEKERQIKPFNLNNQLQNKMQHHEKIIT